MEMLVRQTAELTAKIAGRDPRGADQYEYDLAMIQAELNSRLQTKQNTTVSDTGIEFTSPVHPAAAAPEPGSQSTTA
ncbi:hypothetical protein WG954_15165 [Lacibacter sp. H375]|uniref:hypothetical protein n=1 Tax=Lacibacter sp. H375 TaxID=3133424 RepID=UPI0030C4DA0A